VNLTKLEWYLRRLQRMSAREVGWRLADYTRQRAWIIQQVHPETPARRPLAGQHQLLARRRSSPRLRGGDRRFTATLSPGALASVPPEVGKAVIATAGEILAGRWTVLGVARKDIDEPDWFFDPVTGRRAPDTDYCFRIDHRDERVTGNIKQVWELSRLHHVTVLAGGFALSRERRFAEGAARQLRSWWAQNPFLSGVHWTSGIEVGMRLIAWAWVRRLLDGWDGARALFEDNDDALAQIWWHQHYLASFRSRGSSANNHVIAEAAGQLIGALAFDWFEESEGWAAHAAALLDDELVHNTFPSGVNREMAFDYHGFVAELGLLAAAEAEQAGRPVPATTWETLGRMLDVAAAVVDVRLRAPRQGDSDDGRALVMGPPGVNRWQSLLALGHAVFGAPDWWPASTHDAMSVLVASMAGPQTRRSRPAHRPGHFDDAGLTIMRSAPLDGEELWCRCDGGPHGFLSIAAHAHADALAIEVRHGGVDILADPGTYCYNSEPAWRSYFRSTVGHNTMELADQDQSTSGGPTLWTRAAQTRVIDVRTADDGRVSSWSAEHDGYAKLDPPAWHRRTIRLSSRDRRLEIVDQIRTTGSPRFRLAFHLGPGVRAKLDGCSVALQWDDVTGSGGTAVLSLPAGPSWSLVRASTQPVLGWYSKGFGEKEPTTTVLGEGVCHGSERFETALQFDPARTSG
jgi:hypothetical protein